MNARKLESGPVRDAVRGRWVPVLQALVPELDAALAKPGRHVSCPVHGGRDGFRLFKDVETSGGGICNTCGAFPDGFSLLQWLKGWRFPQALEAVDAALGGVAMVTPVLPGQAPARKNTAEDAQIRQRLAETWAQSLANQDVRSQALRDYLRHRGLDVALLQGVEALRFHPGLRYHDEEGRYGGIFPVMLARVSDAQGKPVTLHRTYLTQAGRKAPVENPKRMMPVPSDLRVLGAAIRLGTAGPVIDLAEGIETALAVTQATRFRAWSAASATLLAGFEPPPGTEKLRIWCDRDRKGVGVEAALKLKARLAAQGILAELLIPPEAMLRGRKGVDWLDVLNEIGSAGFPQVP